MGMSYFSDISTDLNTFAGLAFCELSSSFAFDFGEPKKMNSVAGTMTINQTRAKNSISEVQIKSLPKDGLNLRGFAPIGRGRSRIEFHELNFTRGPRRGSLA